MFCKEYFILNINKDVYNIIPISISDKISWKTTEYGTIEPISIIYEKKYNA